MKCEKCGTEKISERVEQYSKEKFNGKVYCFECQKSPDQASKPASQSVSVDKVSLGECLIASATLFKAVADELDPDGVVRVAKMIHEKINA